MENGFLDKVEDMRLFEYISRK
ncbi:hypothetical protein Gohar_028122, partial [Gossypium harknessii]|nr:hypothetical protein [Gossypium harknessii]